MLVPSFSACSKSFSFDKRKKIYNKMEKVTSMFLTGVLFIGFNGSALAVPFETLVGTSASGFTSGTTVYDEQVAGGPSVATASASSLVNTEFSSSSASASADALTGEVKFTASALGGKADSAYLLVDTLYFSRPDAAVDEITTFTLGVTFDGVAEVSDSGIYDLAFNYGFSGVNVGSPVAFVNLSWSSVFFPFADYSAIYEFDMFGPSAQLSLTMSGFGSVSNGSLNFSSTGAINLNVPSDVTVVSAANNGPASYVTQGDVVSVPEPAGLVMFVSGLVLLSLFWSGTLRAPTACRGLSSTRAVA